MFENRKLTPVFKKGGGGSGLSHYKLVNLIFTIQKDLEFFLLKNLERMVSGI